MKKQEARKLYLEKRKSISLKEKMRLDDLLLLQFQKIDFTGFSNFMSYWPIEKMNEPNTIYITNYLRFFVANFNLIYPVTDFKNNSMKAVSIDENTVYKENNYGIFEPQKGVEFNPNDIDIIITPLIACDKLGRRIGYGKGFYDSFIKKCKNEVLCIGLGYFEPIDFIEDFTQNDMKVDIYITPKDFFEF